MRKTSFRNLSSVKEYCVSVYKNNRSQIVKLVSVIAVLLFIIIAIPALAQDPTGANTGTINDVAAATAGKPTVEEVAAQAGHNKIAINIMWTLLAGFLVMFMQAGFALV